jgi:transcriptional regulator with XRE-family HTH domain
MNYPVANKDLRLLMKQKGLPLWRVARAAGVSEITVSRWLRVDLEPANPKRALILDAITTAEAERGENNDDFGTSA